MNPQPISVPAKPPVFGRRPGLEISRGLLAAGLAFWCAALVCFFAPNRYLMGLWFAVKHLLLPMIAFSLGWLAHMRGSRRSGRSAANLLGIHAAWLIAVMAALPLPLIVLNFLPLGRTVETWRGQVAELSGLPWDDGYIVTVRAETLGPCLRFPVSLNDYSAITAGQGLGRHAHVSGTVIRGFLGVPITARLECAR